MTVPIKAKKADSIARECESLISRAASEFEKNGDTNTKQRWFARHPQVILVLSAAGLIVEAPGANGARSKIDGVQLDDLPFEIRASLIEQQNRIKAEIAANKPTQRSKIERPDPNAERLRLAQEAGQERRRKHMEWIEGLPEDRKARELAKLEEIAEKQREMADARARQIWLRTANEHTVELANRVITDPNRRPRKKVIIATANGPKLMSPRTSAITQSPTTKTKKKTTPKITLDLDF